MPGESRIAIRAGYIIVFRGYSAVASASARELSAGSGSIMPAQTVGASHSGAGHGGTIVRCKKSQNARFRRLHSRMSRQPTQRSEPGMVVHLQTLQGRMTGWAKS